MLLVVLFISSFALWCYCYIFSKWIPDSEQQPESIIHFTLSLVVCCRNDLNHIRENLPLWLNQEFGRFELIVVDDASTDGSYEFLSAIKNDRMKVYRLEENDRELPGKRNALKLGIKKSKGDFILLTDADCAPTSDSWASQMLFSVYSKKSGIGIGMAPFFKSSGWVNKWIRTENLFSHLIYFAGPTLGFPTGGTGRNVIFHQSALTDLSLFENQNTLSGDDDLLINHAGKRVKITSVIHPLAAALSPAPVNYKAWIQQKARHYRAGYQYPFKSKVFIGGFWMASAGFWMSFFISVFWSPELALPMLFVTSLAIFATFRKMAISLKYWDIANQGVLLWFFYWINIVVAATYMFLKKRDTWK